MTVEELVLVVKEKADEMRARGGEPDVVYIHGSRYRDSGIKVYGMAVRQSPNCPDGRVILVSEALVLRVGGLLE
jgi:hypothetical protein